MQAELAIQIDTVDLDGRTESLLEGPQTAHPVMIDSGVIDDLHPAAERFEKKRQVAIGAADVGHRAVPDEFEQSAGRAAQQRSEKGYIGKTIVRVPFEVALLNSSFHGGGELLKTLA